MMPEQLIFTTLTSSDIKRPSTMTAQHLNKKKKTPTKRAGGVRQLPAQFRREGRGRWQTGIDKNAHECMTPHPFIGGSVYDAAGTVLMSKFNPGHNHRSIFGGVGVQSLALDDEIYREAQASALPTCGTNGAARGGLRVKSAEDGVVPSSH